MRVQVVTCMYRDSMMVFVLAISPVNTGKKKKDGLWNSVRTGSVHSEESCSVLVELSVIV